MPFIDICGAIVADTTYVNNVLAAKDVEATLPEVAPVAAEVQAMGTMSLPIWQLIENMELAITKIGVDKGLRSMITPETQSLEMRFVQNVTDANGITKQKGCKAFFKCVPTKIPGIAVTVGEASSNELTFTVMRYQLFVDGEELFLVDRLAGIVRVAGTDYAKTMNSLL